MFTSQNLVEMSLKRLVVDTDKQLGQVIQASVKRAMNDECPCCCSWGCTDELSHKTSRRLRKLGKQINSGKFKDKLKKFQTVDELVKACM